MRINKLVLSSIIFLLFSLSVVVQAQNTKNKNEETRSEENLEKKGSNSDYQADIQGLELEDNGVLNAEVNYQGESNIIAVRGYSLPSQQVWGTGGDFTGGWFGVNARVPSGSTGNYASYGIRGDNLSSGTSTKYGIYGKVTSSTSAAKYGLYGTVQGGGTGVHFGVYGSATGATGSENWAGYFNGNTYVKDTLTVDDRIHINNNSARAERLVVIDASPNYATHIDNPGGSSSNTDGRGLDIVVGKRGITIETNPADENGDHTGIHIHNFTSGLQLTGGHFGVSAYTSGSRAASYGNYSIYGLEGVVAGAGTNWAGYFAGDVRVTGTLDNTSDAKLKKDIVDMKNALNIIKDLSPKTYKFRTEEFPHMALDERPQMGFIAQDMELVLPHLVRSAVHPEFINEEGKETDMPDSPAVDVKSINYIGIIPVLTQGIKELAIALEEKDETIQELASELKALRSEVQQVKKAIRN